MRRQAVGRRRAVPDARRDAGAHHQWPAASAASSPGAELAQLDAGSWHSRAYAGEPLPTLENVARFCLANGYFLNIEIKPTPGLEQRTGEVVAREAARLWADAAVPPLLTSFRPESLAGARQVAPHLPRGLLLDSLWKGWLEIALQLECVALVCNHALWDAGTVTQAQERRLPVPELHRE